MSEPGNELAELLWDNGPALRRPPPPTPFPSFSCTATTTTAHEVFKMRGGDDLAAHGLAHHGGDENEDDAVPWLHYPDADGDGDADTAPLPPDYCSALLSGFSSGAVVPSTPAAPPPAQATESVSTTKQPRTRGGEGGVMNFTFFSRPLQRPPPPGGESASASALASAAVESTVVQAATNRLRSTPLFSDQRMAWLQPPPPPRAAPPPAPLLPTTTPATTVTQRLAPSEARAPDAPPPPPPAAAAAVTATTSSVCSGNGDRSQLKRRDKNQSAEWSASQDELDLDDEPAAHRRSSSARTSKRSRTAEVHNLSERRRRDRINEKMRSLQELIPNCNKIDKASMLEEAIEYLKTLQLQVQMMSMGTGMYMPPMMLPAAVAMQHLQMQQMAHFPHLGAAAMGLAGFAMPGAAAAFDMVPMPRLAAGQFPCPMFPAAAPPPMAMFATPPPQFTHATGEQTAAPGGADAAGDVPVVPQGHQRQQQQTKQS